MGLFSFGYNSPVPGKPENTGQLSQLLPKAETNFNSVDFIEVSQETFFDIAQAQAYSSLVIAKSIAGIDLLFAREHRLSFEELFLCLLYGGLYGAAFGWADSCR